MQVGHTHLHRSVPVVGDLDSDSLATVVDHDTFVLDYDSTGKSVRRIYGWFGCWE